MYLSHRRFFFFSDHTPLPHLTPLGIPIKSHTTYISLNALVYRPPLSFHIQEILIPSVGVVRIFSGMFSTMIYQ